jgi:CelD/BcsL family acetyltransferase involved in cellulose biosynthesis
LRFVFSENDSDEALRKIIAEKRAQYHRTHVRDVLSAERTRAVLHTLYRTRDAQCSGIVSTLHAGDIWVAAHFGLRSASTLHYWFPVYNPALKSFAPGRILLKQIIHSAQSNGLERIDRGGGDSVAKRDFATSQRFFYSGLWQRPSPAALAHHIGLAIDWRLTRFFTKTASE